MSSNPIRLLALGDGAWTVEFGHTIAPEVHAQVMALNDEVQQARQHQPLFASVRDVVPTFRSLTVHFDVDHAQADALGEQLLALAQRAQAKWIQGRHWRLPACFASELAPDLPHVAQARGMSEPKVIATLLATVFRVYMIGFLPGFPYMGGLPPELATPRLASPRQRVPAHSIAIAGEMCAVYPWDSPGGWNLLGRTPVRLFDLQHPHQPAMLAAGDTVQWYAIEREEYDALFSQSQNGSLARERFCQTGLTP